MNLKKMATISNIRSTVVNTFVGVVSVSWVIGMLAILFRNRIPNKDKVFNVIKWVYKVRNNNAISIFISSYI